MGFSEKYNPALASGALKATTRQKYPAVLFAACRDTEYSYDAQFGGVPAGAFTYCAIKALAAQNPKTPADFQMAIRNYLPSRQYPQSPQLYASASSKRGPMF